MILGGSLLGDRMMMMLTLGSLAKLGTRNETDLEVVSFERGLEKAGSAMLRLTFDRGKADFHIL